MMPNLGLPPCDRMRAPPAGIPATTLAKMMMDIPLPMPRWVIELTEPHDEGRPGREGQDR